MPGEQLFVAQRIVERKHPARLTAETHRYLTATWRLRHDAQACASVFVPKSDLAIVNPIRAIGRIEQFGPGYTSVTQQRSCPGGHFLKVPAGKISVLHQTARGVHAVDAPHDALWLHHKMPRLGHLHRAVPESNSAHCDHVGGGFHSRGGDVRAGSEPAASNFNRATDARFRPNDLASAH